MAAFSNNTSSKELCSKVRVTVRVKPCPANKKSIISKVTEDSQMIRIYDELFALDNIKWANESQERVYKAVAYPFVEKTLQGYSATILAYGQAGSGKSFTMGSLVSTTSNWRSSGLIQRCLKHIFEENKIQVSASFVEICNDELYDLLNSRARLTVRKDAAINAKIEKIGSLEKGFELVQRALQLRQEQPAPSSSQNVSSSLSHVVLTLHLKIEDGERCLESKLNLVDLAGLQKVVGQTTEGAKCKVFRCYVDESLSALNEVIAAMSEKIDPVQTLCKNSVLTLILKGLLDSRCLISLVACISSEPADYVENLRTLSFAERAKIVEIQPQITVTSGNSSNSLKATSQKLSGVLPSQPQRIAIVDKQSGPNLATAQSTDQKIKNCTVVLKKFDLDFYRNEKKLQKCKENVAPLSCDETDIKNPKICSAHIESAHSSVTNSTLSISKLQTTTDDDEFFLRTDLCCSQYEKNITWFDDSFSSYSEDMAIAKPAVLHKITDEISDTEYESRFHDFKLQNELAVPFHQLYSGETVVKKQSSLVNNVSQNFESDDEMYEKSMMIFRRAIGGNQMKRMNAILTTDFDESGASETSYHSERKIMKLDKKYPRLRLNLDPESREPEMRWVDENHRENGENQQKELNDKQKAHNDNILRILNSATAAQLTALPQIGVKTAVMLYQYRLLHGDFKSLKDLKNMPSWSKKVCSRFFAANNVILE